jgi:hydroxymethylbilane synthase
MGELVIGTRGSGRAHAQTQIVIDALHRAAPELHTRVERIATTGDLHADVPLSVLGRGVFASEIETALRAKRIDIAVHSAKDLASTLAADLTIAAFLEREDPREVLVSRDGSTLRELKPGARVGTSSPRRTCLVRSLRPDLQIADIRGNIDTRLHKLASGQYDALMIAAAGLIRLGRTDAITEWLDPIEVIPSVGQGALAVEVRTDDDRTVDLVKQLDHAPTRAAVTAERAFLAELGGGCSAAAGAYAHFVDDSLEIVAMIGSPDGRHVRATGTNGAALARELLIAGGAEFLPRGASALAGKRIALTRPKEQSEALAALLRAHGAEPISCPAIAIERSKTDALDQELRFLAAYRWIVFTSANAVNAVADRLDALGVRVPDGVHIAAVGGATGDVIAQRLRRPDFAPSVANAATLASELPDVTGARVFIPRGESAREELTNELRSRGATVRELVVYRTVAASGLSVDDFDAIVFTSPSGVRSVFDAVGARRWRAVVCIGQTTAAAARVRGIRVSAVARTPSVGGIVEALVEYFA